jgi:phosphoglycolate phosphatase-like HAD superfamily hydrolase
MTKNLNIYVDVDDTLVRSVGSKRLPMPAVIQHVRNLKADGMTLFCWSAGGADYARQTAAELGIAECFERFLPKPNVILDDQRMDQWPRSLHVYPAQCESLEAEDYCTRLEETP